MFKSRLSAAALLLAFAILQAGAQPAAQRQGGQGATSQAGGAQAGGAQAGGGQAAGSQAGAPTEPPPPPPNQSTEVPVFRGGISFVRVDVIVNDRKQQPVTDLTQADFEVTEDGRPQKVEQFRVVRIDGTPRSGAPLPPPREIRSRNDEEVEADREDTRVFVIFLDDYHVRRANSISVREPLLQFIQNSLRPADMVAVMYPLTPVSDLSFTRNHASIATAIQRFEGVKFDYRPRNQYEENISRYPTETVERIRNDISMGALRGLSVRLGSIGEGRKSIIYVSEGFTAILPPQMRRNDASQPDNPIMSRLQAGSQDSDFEQTTQWFGQSDVYSRLRDVISFANRNNAAVYSLDPRGLAPFEYGLDDPGGGTYSFAMDRRALQMTQDTLRSLSEETDGRAIVNRNTLAQGLAQITRDSSVYYLLGYNTETPTDGKFHKIEVKVRRRDVDVRARRGYWAATVADTMRQANPTPEIAKPIQLALASISSPALAGRYVRTWLGTSKGDGGKTRVTFVWEPLPATPGARRDVPGRVSLIVADEKGSLVYRGRSPDAALASAGPSAAPNDTGATGPRLPGAAPATTAHRVVFDVPPGKTELRMTIEGTGGAGTLDQEIRSIDVPDLTAPQVAMSTPRVFRSRTVREQQTTAADANAVPTTSREFSRTERLLVRLDAYGVGTESATVTAVLMNRAGQKISDLTVAEAKAGGTHQVDLGLNTVPAGEYVVELAVKSGTQELKDVIAFRISG